jgi:hypothetical protein
MERIVQSTKQWTETKAERKARKARYKAGLVEQQPEPVLKTVMQSKNYVACLKWGDKYSADYVNKLYNMVDRNITIDYEFVCFTENTVGLNKNIKTYPLPKIRADGWWYKPMFVGADLPIKGTLLFLDLDVVVFKNIDKLFAYNPNRFCIIRDFNRSQRKDWNRMNSSVFRINIGAYDNIWQQFKQNPPAHMQRLRGDQDWMFKHITDHQFWPDEWIMSYKWEMRDRRDLKLDPIRKRNFVIDAPPKINPDTCIAVFHGEPNPADANDSWVKEHWQ